MEEFYWNCETGNKDFRLVPIAFAVWFGCLYARFVCEVNHILVHTIIATFAFAFICFCCVFANGMFKVKCLERLKIIKYKQTFYAIVCAFLASFIICSITQCLEGMDPVFSVIKSNGVKNEQNYNVNNGAKNAAKNGDFKNVKVVMKITSPLRTSPSFRGDCVSSVRVKSVEAKDKNNAVQKYASFVDAKLYAFNPVCKAINYGYTISSFARIGISKFGANAVEIQIPKVGKEDKSGKNQVQSLKVIEKAGFLASALNNLYKEFYNVTSNLSEQGKMLVPGLTVGLLGQERLSDDSENKSSQIDSTYANTMKQRFKISGIMHLMAVSGGHFLLIAAMIRKVCLYFLAPKWLCAVLETVGNISLALIVYPSASVLRALIMGIICSIAFLLSRAYQSASALSLTVIGVLFVCPKYAWDYAFALSVCATFGIIVCAMPLKRIFLRYMPSCIASALSITLCAQCFTLPVQILMQPQVSFISILTNLIVTPFVDFATIFGLLSLVFACWNYSISLFFASFSSIGTNIMAFCAWNLGDLQIGVFPWIAGPLGAWLACIAEFSVFFAILFANKYLKNKEFYNTFKIYAQAKSNRFKHLIDDSVKLFE